MLLANVLLALAWTALEGELTLANLFVGYLLGYLVLQVLTRGGLLPVRYLGKVGSFLSLFFFLVYELVLANIKLAKDVLSPARHMRPGIVRVPLDLESDGEILMYAALINLTPGSIVLDLAEDRLTLYVHVSHVESPEASRDELKQGFERRVRRLFE